MARVARSTCWRTRARSALRTCCRSSTRPRIGNGVELPFSATTPYINTIPADKQPPFPGNREIERRIKSIIRWNAMAMVVRANKRSRRPRRPHLHVRLVGHAVRSRLQPLLPRPRRRRLRRRPDLLPRSRLARHVRARVPRRPADRSRTSSTSAANCSRGGGLSSAIRIRG